MHDAIPGGASPGAANSVEVDPNALNTFAQGLQQTTSTLARQAAGEVPALDAEMSKGASMLSEGSSFFAHHTVTATQFMTFLKDATAGIGALADGANVIALNYANTDMSSAAALMGVEHSKDPFSAENLLQLIPVTGSSAQLDATQQDVDDVFAPGRGLGNPMLAMFHSAAEPAPASPPAARTAPAPASDGRSAIDDAQFLAQLSIIPSDGGGTTATSTYHARHNATVPTGVTMPALTVPGDATGQDGLLRTGVVHGGDYDGEDAAALQVDLADMLKPLSDQ
jgi:hypothetical protein